MLSFQSVFKEFGNKTILKNINLEIYPEEFVLLVGPSGAGKSTLMHILLGAQKATRGTILVDGIHIDQLNNQAMQEYRRMLGMVFQDYKLLPQKTVFENIAFALEVCGKSDRFIEERVNTVLQKVNLLDKSEQFPAELSGGEKQRAALARALVHEPKLLIADEPTGNLDHKAGMQVIKLLKQINKEGVTILLATHNQEIVEYLKTRVVTLDEGKIVSDKK